MCPTRPARRRRGRIPSAKGPPPTAAPDLASKPAPLPKPDPPKPADFAGVVVGTSPGPYAVGDKVTVEGGVTDAAGKPRALQGGHFVVLGPDGAPLPGARIEAKPSSNGSGNVSALVTLPIGGTVKIRFEPQSIALTGSELLGNVTPAETSLTASSCRLRGVVLAPVDGAILVAGARSPISGEIRDSAGKPVGAGDLGGARPIFALEVAGKSRKVDAVFDGSGKRVTASVVLEPPASGSQDVVVRLIGEGGGGDFCPDAAVSAKLTALGLGVQVKPTRDCYVGRPCDTVVTFQLPDDATARAAGDSFLKAPDLKVALSMNDTPLTMTAQRPGDVTSPFRGSFTPDVDGAFDLEVVASAGGKEVREKQAIRIRQPIESAAARRAGPRHGAGRHQMDRRVQAAGFPRLARGAGAKLRAQRDRAPGLQIHPGGADGRDLLPAGARRTRSPRATDDDHPGH